MNVIRDSLKLAGKDLKVLFKDKGELAVLFVLPLALALMMGGQFVSMKDPVRLSGEPSLTLQAYLVNEDQGPYGAQVEAVLKSIESLRISSSQSVDRVDRLVAEGETPVAIAIPADFSAGIDANQPVRIQLIVDPAQQMEARAVAGILNEVLTELSVRAEIQYGIRAVYAKTGALDGADPETARAVQAQTMGAIWTAVQEIRQNPAIAVLYEDLSAEKKVFTMRSVAFGVIMPMFATMFAFFLIGTMAGSILQEKEAGAFRRLLAAPIRRGTVIAGKMLAYIVVVLTQMAVLLGICRVIFEIPLGDSPLGLLLLTLALSLASTGLGMLLGTLARTAKQAGNMGMLVGFLLFFAAGFLNTGFGFTGNVVELIRPTGFMFYLSRLTPHAYALDGYMRLMLEGAGLAEIWPNILALVGFGVVFLAIGLWRFRYE